MHVCSERARHFQGPGPQTQASRSLRNRLINPPKLVADQSPNFSPPFFFLASNFCFLFLEFGGGNFFQLVLFPLIFFYQNCCGCPLASTSPVNPNWVAPTQLGINLDSYSEVCFSRVLGLAGRIGWSVAGVMKLKNSTSNFFRETDMIAAQRHYGVRPNQPAIAQTRCRWIIGDVTEVLDHNKWKLGKIAKMLEDNYFVIRLADCIQLKEFHISSLRIPLTQAPAAPHGKRFPAANKSTQRGKQLRADQLKCSGKKRKSSALAEESPRPRQRKSTHHSSVRRVQEEAECSVASCSANGAAEHVAANGGSNRQQRCSVWCGSGNDAMSAARVVPCTTSGEEQESDGVLSDDGPVVDVHELELEAYRSTVQALHASGPLTWEQESLLTNLRLSLNISNEEHLLQLRRLLSS